MSETQDMKVDFNNLRKQAIYAYENLAQKLNGAIKDGEISISVFRIEKEMSELRRTIGLIAMSHDPDDPDINDVFSEVFPSDEKDSPEGPSMTVFNPEE